MHVYYLCPRLLAMSVKEPYGMGETLLLGIAVCHWSRFFSWRWRCTVVDQHTPVPWFFFLCMPVHATFAGYTHKAIITHVLRNSLFNMHTWSWPLAMQLGELKAPKLVANRPKFHASSPGTRQSNAIDNLLPSRHQWCLLEISQKTRSGFSRDLTNTLMQVEQAETAKRKLLTLANSCEFSWVERSTHQAQNSHENTR